MSDVNKRGLKVLEQRNDIIVEMYKAGKTLQNIGTKFGLSRERIRQIVAKRNETLDKREFVGHSRVPKAAIYIDHVRLVHGVMTQKELCDKHGIEPSTYKRCAEHWGWQTREAIPDDCRMIKCTSCNRVQPLTSEYFSPKKKGGWYHRCKACSRAIMRTYYHTVLKPRKERHESRP